MIQGKSLSQLTLKQCLQVYLMTSYLYYHRFTSVIEDSEFDALGKRLYDGWDEFEHQHKHLVTPEDLKAGTLYSLKSNQYPTMITVAADMWAREEYETGRKV